MNNLQRQTDTELSADAMLQCYNLHLVSELLQLRYFHCGKLFALHYIPTKDTRVSLVPTE